MSGSDDDDDEDEDNDMFALAAKESSKKQADEAKDGEEVSEVEKKLAELRILKPAAVKKETKSHDIAANTCTMSLS